MEGNHQMTISDRIQAATVKRIQKYEQLKGKPVGDFPFWDIVVIGSGDKAQKNAYELQLQEKMSDKQLPLGVDYCVVADPGTDKIGGGGSLMAILQCLKEVYQDDFKSKKVLVIPAGGYSQRLPNASLLGKMFISMPLGSPPYQMLDVKLALSVDFPAKMTAGIFLVASDCIELYDDSDSEAWSFGSVGVTCLGHPSTIGIGTGHGVFVIPPRDNDCPPVEVVEVLEFLHKPSMDEMRNKGAILSKDFCKSLQTDVEEEMVLTDSSYFMDFDTAFKLMELYEDESPLRCEIDCHGDFLQPLGPRASPEYIKNTSNISKVTQSLAGMRQKVFDVLKGTSLSVAVMQHSRFYHVGTTNEYLDHLCNVTSLAKELGLDLYQPSNPDEGSQKKLTSACVMNSLYPDHFQIAERSIVEHCEFRAPVQIQSNSIISSCVVGPLPDENPLIIPQGTFLYTASVTDGRYKKEFVTVAFGIGDNLKKVVQANNFGDLSLFGRSFAAIFGTNLELAEGVVLPDGAVRSLWHAKLFQPKATMEEAFSSTLSLVKNLLHDPPSLSDWEGGVSMADLIQTKDIFAMHEFRVKLTERVQGGNNN